MSRTWTSTACQPGRLCLRPQQKLGQPPRACGIPGCPGPYIALQDDGKHVSERVLHLALPDRRHVLERAQRRQHRRRLHELRHRRPLCEVNQWQAGRAASRV